MPRLHIGLKGTGLPGGNWSLYLPLWGLVFLLFLSHPAICSGKSLSFAAQYLWQMALHDFTRQTQGSKSHTHLHAHTQWERSMTDEHFACDAMCWTRRCLKLGCENKTQHFIYNYRICPIIWTRLKKRCHHKVYLFQSFHMIFMSRWCLLSCHGIVDIRISIFCEPFLSMLA